MSTKNISAAHGTTLEIGDPAVAVAHLKSIGSPEQSKETIDVTALDSEGNYREYIDSYRDAGELSVSGFFDFRDEGQKAIRDAYDAEGAIPFVIRYPKVISAEWHFNGIVTSYKITSEEGDAIGFDATIKLSGKPTLIASSASSYIVADPNA